MALLTRKLQKIFALNAPSGEVGVIGSKAGGTAVTSKDLDTLQSDARLLLGYFSTTSDQGTTKLPYTQEQNAIDYILTTQLKYLFQNGIPEYLDTEEYYPGISFCQDEGIVWGLKSGQASPTTGQKPSANLDKWDPISSKVNKQEVSASGSLTFGFAHQEIEIDTSGGDISINALPAPNFIGQKVHIFAIGSGAIDIAGGNGIYTNGVYISENTDGLYIEGTDVGGVLEWKAKNTITYDGPLGGFDKALRYPSGMCDLIGEAVLGFTSAAQASVIATLPFTAQNNNYYANSSPQGLSGSKTVVQYLCQKTTTTTQFRYETNDQAVASGNVTLNIFIKGIQS